MTESSYYCDFVTGHGSGNSARSQPRWSIFAVNTGHSVAGARSSEWIFRAATAREPFCDNRENALSNNALLMKI